MQAKNEIEDSFNTIQSIWRIQCAKRQTIVNERNVLMYLLRCIAYETVFFLFVLQQELQMYGTSFTALKSWIHRLTLAFSGRDCGCVISAWQLKTPPAGCICWPPSERQLTRRHKTSLRTREGERDGWPTVYGFLSNKTSTPYLWPTVANWFAPGHYSLIIGAIPSLWSSQASFAPRGFFSMSLANILTYWIRKSFKKDIRNWL